MSSLSNFAVNIYIARTLGAAQYGAFSLAYVTYGFALNASRGLATDPLLVRFSGTDIPTWRRAVGRCTGTATVVGLVAGAVVLGVAALLSGTARLAFLALGLTLPGLLLQDSWRFSFFALDAAARHSSTTRSGRWCCFLPWCSCGRPATRTCSGSSSRGAQRPPSRPRWAPAGPGHAQAAPPRGVGVRHRDLGPRYLAEGTANSASTQLRNYGVGIILGLAAVGYVQAATTLMGPFMVIFFGMGLVTVPEAARILRRSPRHLPLFCLLVERRARPARRWRGEPAAGGAAEGARAIDAGLRSGGRPTRWCCRARSPSWADAPAGAGTGLHALGAARRSLRAMVLASALYVVCGLAGAVVGGAVGTTEARRSHWIGALLFWWQLRHALRERDKVPVEPRPGVAVSTDRTASRLQKASPDGS